MSEAETVVYSAHTSTVHRQDSGLEPACADRLHNAAGEQYRLTYRRYATGGECQHPECFGD